LERRWELCGMRPDDILSPDPVRRLRGYRLLQWAGFADVAIGTALVLLGDRLFGTYLLFADWSAFDCGGLVILAGGAIGYVVATILIRGAEAQQGRGP
jgi:hypothetical protein